MYIHIVKQAYTVLFVFKSDRSYMYMYINNYGTYMYTYLHVDGCLNLLIIHYKGLRGKEHVVSALPVSRMIVESTLLKFYKVSLSLVVLDGRRKAA